MVLNTIITAGHLGTIFTTTVTTILVTVRIGILRAIHGILITTQDITQIQVSVIPTRNLIMEVTVTMIVTIAIS